MPLLPNLLPPPPPTPPPLPFPDNQEGLSAPPMPPPLSNAAEKGFTALFSRGDLLVAPLLPPAEKELREERAERKGEGFPAAAKPSPLALRLPPPRASSLPCPCPDGSRENVPNRELPTPKPLPLPAPFALPDEEENMSVLSIAGFVLAFVLPASSSSQDPHLELLEVACEPARPRCCCCCCCCGKPPVPSAATSWPSWTTWDRAGPRTTVRRGAFATSGDARRPEDGLCEGASSSLPSSGIPADHGAVGRATSSCR